MSSSILLPNTKSVLYYCDKYLEPVLDKNPSQILVYGIYGSVVFDEYIPNWSDIDLMVIISNSNLSNNKYIFEEINKLKIKLETIYQAKIGISVYTLESYRSHNSYERILQLNMGKFRYNNKSGFNLLLKEANTIIRDNRIKNISSIAFDSFLSKHFKFLNSTSEMYPLPQNLHLPSYSIRSRINNLEKKISLATYIDNFFELSRAFICVECGKLLLSKQAVFKEFVMYFPDSKEIVDQIKFLWSNWNNFLFDIEKNIHYEKICDAIDDYIIKMNHIKEGFTNE